MSLTIKRGDILEFKRFQGLFYHYGIYLGDNKVIHRDKEEKGGKIYITDLDKIPGKMRIVQSKFPRINTEVAIATALDIKKNHEEGYNVLTNNCEHFVNFVKYNELYSSQVINIKKILSVSLFILIISLHNRF